MAEGQTPSRRARWPGLRPRCVCVRAHARAWMDATCRRVQVQRPACSLPRRPSSPPSAAARPLASTAPREPARPAPPFRRAGQSPPAKSSACGRRISSRRRLCRPGPGLRVPAAPHPNRRHQHTTQKTQIVGENGRPLQDRTGNARQARAAHPRKMQTKHAAARVSDGALQHQASGSEHEHVHAMRRTVIRCRIHLAFGPPCPCNPRLPLQLAR